jgi:hypothetical protein
MKRNFLLFFLISGLGLFAQKPNNYTQDLARRAITAGKFDSTLHIPFGPVPKLGIGGWNGNGAVFYNTTDSSVYVWNGLTFERQLNDRDTLRFSAGGGNAMVKGSSSILITPDGDSSVIAVKDDYINGLIANQLSDSTTLLRGIIIDTAASLSSSIASKGSVNTIGIATANGFTGTSDGNANNPTLTIGTDRTGLLYGNGTSMSGRKIGADFIWATDTLKNGSFVNVRDYGATGDNVTNDRTAFLNAIATGKNVYVPPGSYYLNGPSDGGWQLTLSVGQKIFGDGLKSKLRINSNTRLMTIANNCVVSGLSFEGSGKSADLPWQSGILVYDAIGFSIENCFFTAFAGLSQQNGGGAIYLVAIASANSDGGRISNNYFYNNNAAASFGERGEYVVVSNNTFGNNNVAVGVGAGNVSIVGNVIQNNITGIRMFTGVNNAHNLVSDNLINHNTYPIDITDVPYTTGLTFTNNHIFNGSLKIKDAKNVKFSDCQFQFLDSIYLDNTSDIQFVNTWIGRTGGNATIPIRYYNGAAQIATIGQMRNINGTANTWINQVNPDTINLVGPTYVPNMSAGSNNGRAANTKYVDDAIALIQSSGYYTPSSTPGSNTATLTPYETQWMRVGDIVTVTGSIGYETTAPGDLVFDLAIPVDSDFSAGTQLNGTGNDVNSENITGTASANVSDNRAVIVVRNGAASGMFKFQFTYRIVVL